MDKEQRDRKRRLRERWRQSSPHHQLSYLLWLEERFDEHDAWAIRMVKSNFEKDRRISAFADYISDMETGMRAVEQASLTIGVRTTIPAPVKENQSEAVRAAIIWLYRILADAKGRFLKGVAVDQAEPGRG